MEIGLSVANAISCPRNLLLLKDAGLAGGSWPVQGRSVNQMNIFTVIEMNTLLYNFSNRLCTAIYIVVWRNL